MNKKSECIKIYREAFGEEDVVFEEKLFENCFEYCRFSEADGQIATMLFALPCKIEQKDNTLDAIYIFAAATQKEYRSKGFMSRLIEELKRESDAFIFLRPANEGLIDFYQNCGFTKAIATDDNCGFPVVKPIDKFALLAEDITTGNGEDFTVMYYSKSNLNIDKLHFIYSME